MGDDSGEKSEEATDQKLRKAREEGQVAKSQDLGASVLLAVGAAALVFMIGDLAERYQNLMKQCFSVASEQRPSTGTLLQAFVDTVQEFGRELLPIGLVLMFFGVAVNFLQVGGLFTLKPMIPKLEKFNPAKGLKRMFAEMKTYVELIKSVMKMTVVALVVYIVISSEIEKIITLSYRQPAAIAMVIGGFLAKCTFAVAPVFFAIAVLDLLYQRWQFSKDQRMTKDEVKREHKDSEGDPQHKQARQSAHQEILNDNMVQSVRKADAVVTNPTHIACALKYDPDEENAPRLIAKGQGWLADQIKQVAKEEDIPIVRDKSLARALYEMQLDEQISEDMFDAVAEVLRWVEMIARSRGEVPAWVQDGDPGQGGQGGAPAGPKSYYG